MSFRALLYTDCRADESLRGGTGYQFQAASPDARPTDELVMMQELMYRPSSELMAREAPVSEYPPSFAYFRTTDGFAMAAGVYLGRVSGDGRQGNQITHGLFTDDADDLAATRPAQLSGADFWVHEKQPSKELACVEPPLLYREEFDLPELHRIATLTTNAEELIAKLISAFEKATSETWVKAIVSCSDPQLAMQWIALGTMLLPAERALSLSIRAFVSDPLSATQRIVAVHPPSLNKRPDVTTMPGVSGIDLDALAAGPIEVTDLAAFWARRFVEGDPYEVIEAIELGGRLRGPEYANRLVAAVVVLGEPLRSTDDLDAVCQSVETFDADEYDELAGQLVDALERLDEPDELTPEGCLRMLPVVRRLGGDSSELMDRIQTNLLERAARSVAFASRLIADTSWRWTWLEQPDVGSRAAQALTAAVGSVETDGLPAAFEFAARVGTPADPNDLRDPIQRLADHWLHNPQLSERRRGWLHGDRVQDLMIQELERQVGTEVGADVEGAIAHGQWDWLLDLDWIVHGGGPLAAGIACRSIPNAEPRRQKHLYRLMARSGGPGGWQGLWRNRTPELNEVVLWLELQPGDVRDPRFAEPAGRAIADTVDSGQFRGGVLLLIDDLYAAAPDLLPARVAHLGRQNMDVSRALAGIRSRRAAPDAGGVLAAADPIILNIRMAELTKALVEAGDIECLRDFLQKSSVDPADELVTTLDAAAQRLPVATLRTAFALSRVELPKSLQEQVAEFPLRWYESASDEVRAEVGSELSREGSEWAETEAQYERKHESAVKKVARLFGSRDKGRN